MSQRKRRDEWESETYVGDGDLWCLNRCDASSFDDGKMDTIAGDR